MATVIKRQKWSWGLEQKSRNDREQKSRPAVWANCPGCDGRFRLDHEIAADGTLSPSLDCPTCSFHESGVQLEGWPGEPA